MGGQDAMVVFGGEQDSFKIPCFFGGNVLKQGKMIMSDANREALWLRAAADLLFLKQTAKQYGLADIDLEMSCGYYQNNTVVNLLDPVETKRGWLERRNHYILNGWKDDGPYIKTFARHLRSMSLKDRLSKKNKSTKGMKQTAYSVPIKKKVQKKQKKKKKKRIKKHKKKKKKKKKKK